MSTMISILGWLVLAAALYGAYMLGRARMRAEDSAELDQEWDELRVAQDKLHADRLEYEERRAQALSPRIVDKAKTTPFLLPATNPPPVRQFAEFIPGPAMVLAHQRALRRVDEGSHHIRRGTSSGNTTQATRWASDTLQWDTAELHRLLDQEASALAPVSPAPTIGSHRAQETEA